MDEIESSKDALNQDALKLKIKLWLKGNRQNYAWLAEQCFVSEATVRNWMARKVIPAAKVHIICKLMKEASRDSHFGVLASEETYVSLRLDSFTRRSLEQKAISQGLTLTEFLAKEVPALAY
ncbi:MAG: hypothetical protein IKW46_00565 [Bacteroidaceae bacterium]|nr:hypothetical protein [Bacteroidaceae bacterium]